MTIIEAIQSAVEAGKLREPFTLQEVAAVIKEYVYGSLQAALSRHSRQGRKRLDPPLCRLGPGLYCLAQKPAKAHRKNP